MSAILLTIYRLNVVRFGVYFTDSTVGSPVYDTAIYETIETNPPLSCTDTVIQKQYEDDGEYEHIIDNVKITKNPCYTVPWFKTAY